MNIKNVSLLIILTGNALIGYAKETKTSQTQVFDESNKATETQSYGGAKKTLDALKKITPELMYSYIDFKFDSTTRTNFNRFKGHSNIYSAGADHIILNDKTTLGVYYYKVDTYVNSSFTLEPLPAGTAKQKIHNNAIFAHILRSLGPKWYFDFGGAYGHNILHTDFSMANLPDILAAFSNNRNANWFVTGNLIYIKAWKKLNVRANFSPLYIRTDTGAYNVKQTATNIFTLVTPLTNQAVLLQETVELGYSLNDNFSPFINGGLIQVAYYKNSRPLLAPDAGFNGLLPQLDLNKNAYRVGAGVSFHNKNISLRLEEKYYNAANTFTSYQTTAAGEYRFD